MIRRWLERLSPFNFKVFHRKGEDMVDANFLSRLDTLRDATPTKAAATKLLDNTYALLFPLNKMYATIDAAKLTAGSCAIIQTAAEDQAANQATVIEQPCSPGGRCDACTLGAIYEGSSISTITPPPSTMGELQDQPPVVHPETGVYHVCGGPEERPDHQLVRE